MKRNLPQPFQTISPKKPELAQTKQQHFFFRMEDGCRLVDFQDTTGAPIATHQILDFDALRRLVQQKVPPGPATIVLDKTAILATTGSHPAANAPPDADLVLTLLSCHPVAATLMACLSLKQWCQLRCISHCWRDAVDVQLKSLKQLDLDSCIKITSKYLDNYHRQMRNLLLEFMSAKAPKIEFVYSRNWLPECPHAINKFGNLKHLDLGGWGVTVDLKPFAVLEKLTILEYLESISFDVAPHSSGMMKPIFKETFEKSLMGLFLRFSALKSLTVTIHGISFYSSLLGKLPNPKGLEFLSVEGTCHLQTMQSLTKFSNLQTLKIHPLSVHEDQMAALEDSLKQLPLLNRLQIDSCYELSMSCATTIMELPNLQWFATSQPLSEGIRWTQFKHLSCLELKQYKPPKESVLNSINCIISLKYLKIGFICSSSEAVRFSCRLPQLHTLCLGAPCILDFHPACCNLTNLTLLGSRLVLENLSDGLLQHNPGIRKLRIAWQLDLKPVLDTLESIASFCKSLETLELNLEGSDFVGTVHSYDHLPSVVRLFLQVCPLLKSVKTASDGVASLKSTEEFRHLNISACALGEDNWMR